MAAAVPVILGAVGGGAVGYGVATTLALGTVGTAVATATGAVVGAALMAPRPQAMALETDEVTEVTTVDTDDTVVNTSSPTGGSDTTINDVVDLQTGLIDTADTSVAGEQSTGVGEDSAIDFYDRGRQATILTTSQGLLTDAVSGVGTLLKPTPGLAGAGLIS
jgi:hypothetical protein|tara:strand:- start:833 stop:1321 length:489 start_codon:yes stop_codon:yes gene_type:complete